MKDKNNKIVTLRFRCTAEEKSIFIRKSEQYKSFSHYVRKNLLEKEGQKGIISPTEVIKTIDNLVFELNRIGNNINQIAKYINQRKETNHIVLAEYEQILKNLVEVEKKIELNVKNIINNI